MDQRSRVVRARQRFESSCSVSSQARTVFLLLLRRGRLVREARGRLGAREPGPPAGRTARDCRAVCLDGQQAWLERFSDALHAPRLSPPLPPLRKGGKVGGVWSFSPLAKGGHRGVLRVPLRCARFVIHAIENRSKTSLLVTSRESSRCLQST